LLLTKISDMDKDKNKDMKNSDTENKEQETKKEKSKKVATKKKEKGGSQSKMKKELEEKTIELAELKDKYLRLFAEFDNYKKRTVKEKLTLMKTASQDIMESILPVLDDFDRAKKSADDENNSEVFSEGVSMVYNKLNSLLKSKGLEQMNSTGETFDPELHEAITEIPAPTEDMKGKVVDTIENGYLLTDKIIRHAKVVVGK
jgi:molecular chaperone GrpE